MWHFNRFRRSVVIPVYKDPSLHCRIYKVHVLIGSCVPHPLKSHIFHIRERNIKENRFRFSLKSFGRKPCCHFPPRQAAGQCTPHALARRPNDTVADGLGFCYFGARGTCVTSPRSLSRTALFLASLGARSFQILSSIATE